MALKRRLSPQKVNGWMVRSGFPSCMRASCSWRRWMERCVYFLCGVCGAKRGIKNLTMSRLRYVLPLRFEIQWTSPAGGTFPYSCHHFLYITQPATLVN